MYTQRPISSTVGRTPPRNVSSGSDPVWSGLAVTTAPSFSSALSRWSSANVGRLVAKCAVVVGFCELEVVPFGELEVVPFCTG